MELSRDLRARTTRKIDEIKQVWPNLNSLLTSLDKSLTCFQISQVADGHKAIFRFQNDYGLEIFKYFDSDFFEIVVIRFPGEGIDTYEFATDTGVSRFNLGCTEEDIFQICSQVSRLNQA
uniref:DUF5655 domain-containing protein n=1 Tax=Desulfobacca acetoxidans TaxID=60893 RepID=A0A7C3V9A7_9BACT